ncbi:sigma-70 family RNA polymerase sigma factor [Flavilitoribacter nigricans]|uniref:RNA polymerase subunit sigma n=1 Tax=Flavilitoribacter nigricans (strain ATCC 23147 / DSM 23189 / NBRC 102662 / NCIMB 1420 / SS-2) TaxID=1122177 RepID=A0A2D0N028_FLAN2|nr:RNA polymerase sigma factor RpoD/SigA [Flavilitoribacter nigricans]PHN01881.1 RNA polymerase subunit sigma [Flavilitoribacter nigricans DSM 23189 = NBRC 102662]
MRHLTIFPAIPQASRSLESYLSELNNIPLITAEEEIRLARRIRAGDEQALALLVRANLRFVVSVAKQYQNAYIPLMDLISEGNIGLVEAARRFDETRGFKFISFAVWWIRKSILEAIREKSRLVRLPGNKLQQLSRVRSAMTSLEQTLEREPTLEELAEPLELGAAELRDLLELMPRRVSLHTPLETGEPPTLLETLVEMNTTAPDQSLAETTSQRIAVDQLLAGLSKREQRILRLRFGLAGDPSEEWMSYEEIGKRVGLCAERVRLLKNRALLKLRMMG